MDLPYNLTDNKLVSGMDELAQTLTILCKNYVGTFHQSPKLGAHFSIHMPAPNMKEMIKQTLEEVQGVKVSAVDVKDNEFIAQISYYDKYSKFTFVISDENS